jgi:hypothetical protein
MGLVLFVERSELHHIACVGQHCQQKEKEHVTLDTNCTTLMGYISCLQYYFFIHFVYRNTDSREPTKKRQKSGSRNKQVIRLCLGGLVVADVDVLGLRVRQQVLLLLE